MIHLSKEVPSKLPLKLLKKQAHRGHENGCVIRVTKDPRLLCLLEQLFVLGPLLASLHVVVLLSRFVLPGIWRRYCSQVHAWDCILLLLRVPELAKSSFVKHLAHLLQIPHQVHDIVLLAEQLERLDMLHRDGLAVHVQDEHRALGVVPEDVSRDRLPVGLTPPAESAGRFEDSVQAAQFGITERVAVRGPLAFVLWSGLDPKVLGVVHAAADPRQAEREGEDRRPLDGRVAGLVRHCDDLVNRCVAVDILVRVKTPAVAEAVDLDGGDGLVGVPRDVDHTGVLVQVVHQGVEYLRDVSHLDVFNEAEETPGVGAFGRVPGLEGKHYEGTPVGV